MCGKDIQMTNKLFAGLLLFLPLSFQERVSPSGEEALPTQSGDSIHLIEIDSISRLTKLNIAIYHRENKCNLIVTTPITPQTTKIVESFLSVAEFQNLLDVAQEVNSLPKGDQESREDIYGFGTTINVYRVTKQFFRNRGPYVETPKAPSKVLPTDAQKKRFHEIATHIKTEVQRYLKQSSASPALHFPRLGPRGDCGNEMTNPLGKILHLIEGIDNDSPRTNTLRLMITITQQGDTSKIEVSKKDPRGFLLNSTINIPDSEFRNLLDSIPAIWTLPTEKPDVCSDIYGLETGLSLKDASKEWTHRLPFGCDRFVPDSVTTQAQKKVFQEVCQRIKEKVHSLIPEAGILKK